MREATDMDQEEAEEINFVPRRDKRFAKAFVSL